MINKVINLGKELNKTGNNPLVKSYINKVNSVVVTVRYMKIFQRVFLVC